MDGGTNGKESGDGNYLDKVEEEMNRGKHYDFKAEYLEAREKPCRINQVVVRGNERTKPNTILQEFQGVRNDRFNYVGSNTREGSNQRSN